nr:putative integron gene cassette protein [uncultured bacterium]
MLGSDCPGKLADLERHAPRASPPAETVPDARLYRLPRDPWRVEPPKPAEIRGGTQHQLEAGATNLPITESMRAAARSRCNTTGRDCRRTT